MSFEFIVDSIKTGYICFSLTKYCPICNNKFHYNLVHNQNDPEKHSLFYNSSIIDYFINPYTDLISFSKDYFNIIYYTENDHQFISEHKFDYTDIKDLEVKTIKEFVEKIKINMVFL